MFPHCGLFCCGVPRHGGKHGAVVGEPASVVGLGQNAVAVDGQRSAYEDIVDQHAFFQRKLAEFVVAPRRAIDERRGGACVGQVSRDAVAGYMSHHIAFGCGIEVAGYNYRTVATQLTDAVEYQGDPFATSHLPYMVEVSVEGKEFFCGFLVAEHGPGCDAYAGSVPSSRPLPESG